ncbi:MAG: acetyl-CoA carboxylase biotin carboxylase subunit [Omnitrophica WOR_2 bacterium RBG_13_44_8]|nr:MAG: acetyl-CoA carboxylase biotin carboxylase subunit [Omnitrophica WOR_2 bacterium RBG_13_44_8]
MFERVLIANRGEIAVRIIRACRDMGIESVAVYSEADRECLHTMIADRAICIGPPPSKMSYLNMTGILSAAKTSGCQAIHPGYGFLSENADFVMLCRENEIEFIGPSHDSILIMGDKAAAKRLMRTHRIPVIPGSDGSLKNESEAMNVAKKISFPVIIKAAAGGGGRGMRIANDEKELRSLLDIARQEARSAFGNDEIYIEKYLDEPRHVEVQIAADKYGNCIHLGERDCSIQRRHQKLIEESPAIFITERKRKEMGEIAVRAARITGYFSVGTVEFLVDKNGNYYFMEMNTRIQVEHPVTESITGIDLVKMQLAVAAGEKIGYEQHDIKYYGHAIEFRINAEDTANDFRPTPGRISKLLLPGGPGIRIDTHVFNGYNISSHYDSLLMKLIVWGRDRDEAIVRSIRAFSETVIEGVPTTIPFHQKILKNAFFKKGNYYTNFISRRMSELN